MPLSSPKPNGRPPMYAEPMTVLTCAVPQRIVADILAEAARDDRTRSYVIRRILKAHFDAADAAGAGWLATA